MKAFLTGGTGFIGRRLTQVLLEQGYEVYSLVREITRSLPSGVHPVVGDILNHNLGTKLPKTCDVVFHLAGLVSFRTEMRSELIRVNETGTRHVLDTAAIWPDARIVVTSSACTIGITQSAEEELDEKTPPHPELAHHNPYLDSKQRTEEVCFEAAARGQQVVVVNPTTVYGSGDDTLNSGTLIKTVIISPVIPVPPGGSNIIDLDDVVAGILAAARHGKSGERYILGGFNLPFAEIIRTIIHVANVHPFQISVPRFLANPMALAASCMGKMGANRFLTPQIVSDLFDYKYYSSAKAEQEVGWKAYRSFSNTVTDALQYYRQKGLIS